MLQVPVNHDAMRGYSTLTEIKVGPRLIALLEVNNEPKQETRGTP